MSSYSGGVTANCSGRSTGRPAGGNSTQRRGGAGTATGRRRAGVALRMPAVQEEHDPQRRQQPHQGRRIDEEPPRVRAGGEPLAALRATPGRDRVFTSAAQRMECLFSSATL